MAVDKIIHNSPEMFTLERNTSLSSSTGRGIFFPESNIVLFYAECSHSSDLNTSTVIATIPSKYRPSAGVDGLAFRLSNSSNATFSTHMGSVSTNGQIKEGATSSYRSALVIGIYTI